jgi:negative regulator of flagellin synthesis FlgM
MMKIDNSGKPLGAALNRTDSRPSSKTSSESSGAAEVGGDNVDITSFSARLASLEANLGSQPVMDEAKISEIRQAIAEGRFSVNPDAIADKLMASVKELLAKP